MERALRGIDWNFRGSRKGYLGPLHWYPGTFVKGLSDTVVQALTKPGDLVIDPFGGIGTTASSSLIHSRRAYSADLNPIAALASYVTVGLVILAKSHPSELDALFGFIDRSLRKHRTGQTTFPDAMALSALDAAIASALSPGPADFKSSLRIREPSIPNLEQWVAPQTLASIEEWLREADQTRSNFAELTLLCMLSATLRAASSQHASWGHLADNVRPKVFSEHDVDALCARWLVKTRRMCSAVAEGPAQTVQVVCADSSLAEVPRGAMLLLTSPPYAGAIDYNLSQRLSLYLFGYDDPSVQALVSSEIGARRKRFKSTSITSWSEAMVNVIARHAAEMNPQGSICLVLPHKESGRRMGEDAVIQRLGESGWELTYETDRSIHQSHTRQSWTSIKQETLLFFARGSR